MRKFLLFILVVLNFSIFPIANAKDQVIIDRLTKQEAEELDIQIPDDVPPGFHNVTIEVYDDNGTVSQKTIEFCKDENDVVQWDNNCPNLKIAEFDGPTNSDLKPYDPLKDKERTKGLQIAAFAILSALTITKRDDDREKRTEDEEEESLQSISSGGLKLLKDEPGRGDLSRIWVNPLTEKTDLLFIRVATFLNGRSPLLTRTSLDGSTLRSIIGGWATLLPFLGAVFGVVSIIDSQFESLPPRWWIVAAVMAIALFDAMAGLIAGAIFFSGALITGNIAGRPEFLSGLGVLVLFFAPALLASSFRSFRRLIRNDDDLWERFTDYLLGAVLTYWVVTKMVDSMSGLARLDLPITKNGTALGEIAAVLLYFRLLLEDIAVTHFPMRLRSLYVEILPFTHRQKIASLVFKIVVFFLMAAPFAGSFVNLFLGTLIFTIPQVTSLNFEDKLPKKRLYLPRGVLKTVMMVFVMALVSHWIEGLFSDPATFLRWSFVVMALPGFFLHYLDAISLGRDQNWRRTKEGRLIYRLGGIVVFILMVLIVKGIDITSWLIK